MNYPTKFLLAALAIALCAAVAPLRAADESDAPPPPPPPDDKAPCEAGRPHGHGPRGEHLRHLARELDLTDAQKTKIKALAQEERDALKTLRAEGAKEHAAARAKAQALRESFRAKIRAELTPEQQAKFDALPARPRRHDGPREQCRPMPPPPCEGHDAPPPPPEDDDDAPAAGAPEK